MTHKSSVVILYVEIYVPAERNICDAKAALALSYQISWIPWHTVTGPNSKPDSLLDDQQTNAELERYPQSTVKVKQGWEVRSDETV